MTLSVAPAPSPRLLVSAPRCASSCARDPGGALCSYQIAWSINPHMRVRTADSKRASQQHATFVRLLEHLGASVRRLPFVHGAFDSVFMKDNALLIHEHARERALLSRPRHAERRQEQHARRRALEARGFEVSADVDAPFEGGDVVMLPRGRGAFLGNGFRSSRAAVAAVERFLGAPVVPLTLRDPHLYHLDMAMTALSDGTVALCEEAFDARSLATIEREVAAARGSLVVVSRAEALGFALNVVEVCRAVVLGGPSERLQVALRARGYETHVAELDEFHRAGGSAACLVARVHDHARVAVSTTAAIRSTAA